MERLINFGVARLNEEWPDYVTKLKLTDNHIDKLIDIIYDVRFDDLPEEDVRCFASVHAYRSLGQLKAEKAIIPLLNFIHNNKEEDFTWELIEFEKVFKLIGNNGVVLLLKVFSDSKYDFAIRECVFNSLTSIIKESKTHLRIVLNIMKEVLEDYENNDIYLNMLIINKLMGYNYTNAIKIVEQVMLKRKVYFEKINLGEVELFIGKDFLPEDFEDIEI